jgi:hypothetical protein
MLRFLTCNREPFIAAVSSSERTAMLYSGRRPRVESLGGSSSSHYLIWLLSFLRCWRATSTQSFSDGSCEASAM